MKTRNAFVLSAHKFKSCIMKDKRLKRKNRKSWKKDHEQ